MSKVVQLPSKDARYGNKIRSLLTVDPDLTEKGVEIAMEILNRHKSIWPRDLNVTINHPEGEPFTQKQVECIKEALNSVKDQYTLGIRDLLKELAVLKMKYYQDGFE